MAKSRGLVMEYMLDLAELGKLKKKGRVLVACEYETVFPMLVACSVKSPDQITLAGWSDHGGWLPLLTYGMSVKMEAIDSPDFGISPVERILIMPPFYMTLTDLIDNVKRLFEFVTPGGKLVFLLMPDQARSWSTIDPLRQLFPCERYVVMMVKESGHALHVLTRGRGGLGA